MPTPDATPTPEAPEFLLTSELSQRIRVPEETCRYWRHVGKGPASFKVGRRVLYRTKDVQAWLEEARLAGTAA